MLTLQLWRRSAIEFMAKTCPTKAHFYTSQYDKPPRSPQDAPAQPGPLSSPLPGTDGEMDMDTDVEVGEVIVAGGSVPMSGPGSGILSAPASGPGSGIFDSADDNSDSARTTSWTDPSPGDIRFFYFYDLPLILTAPHPRGGRDCNLPSAVFAATTTRIPAAVTTTPTAISEVKPL